ncbi:putative DNA-directed DNA polymerase [Bradyrhizobium sp. ORS 375]|uniref:DNA-directed DNA polymerase n=1 Tax=Bradyrhizobium sp. (strain ORS 375) TaxID=566679 RepID=UPI0002406400|nr:DNA-directed DNA polymerase [Bradyrhizobium sp. ORS 375]CCD94625.1 putative DNA-directed DNA polymerase [Bradyrhizobium sp. ORS 375]
MKFKINRDKLADIVTRGVSSAPKNSPAVIANNARIIAQDGAISIATTDFEMMVEAFGECEVEANGATTIDAMKLKAVVDRLPKGVDVSITMDTAKYELVCKAGRSRTTFPTLAAEDWPAREYATDGAKFALEGCDLIRLFGHTAQALSTIPNSPMQGVFLHFADDGKRLAAVGTTGTILFKATVPVPDGAEDMPLNDNRPGVILSSETVSSVLRLFRNADTVNVIVNSNSIFFYTDTTRFCSSLLVGTYPNYLPLVSNPVAESIVVSRESCASTVALLETFASKELGHRLQCAGSEEGFVIAVGGTTGGSVDVVEATISGEIAAFGINGVFMKTMLNSFRASSIALHPDARNRRILFLADDEHLTGVIAMMNIATDLASGPKHE